MTELVLDKIEICTDVQLHAARQSATGLIETLTDDLVFSYGDLWAEHGDTLIGLLENQQRLTAQADASTKPVLEKNVRNLQAGTEALELIARGSELDQDDRRGLLHLPKTLLEVAVLVSLHDGKAAAHIQQIGLQLLHRQMQWDIYKAEDFFAEQVSAETGEKLRLRTGATSKDVTESPLFGTCEIIGTVIFSFFAVANGRAPTGRSSLGEPAEVFRETVLSGHMSELTDFARDMDGKNGVHYTGHTPGTLDSFKHNMLYLDMLANQGLGRIDTPPSTSRGSERGAS